MRVVRFVRDREREIERQRERETHREREKGGEYDLVSKEQ